MSAWLEAHVHTKAGSADSSIVVDALGRHAAERGTGAVVVSEHFRVWSDWERSAFHDRWGVRVYRAIEATTNRGHIILLGVPEGTSPQADAIELLERARHEHWYSILAHPFRHYFDRIHASQRPAFEHDLDAGTLASDRVFELVDAIEVENGGCNERENAMAISVATLVGKPVTVGSDAHHIHELGGIRMPIPAVPANTGELIDLISSNLIKTTAPTSIEGSS